MLPRQFGGQPLSAPKPSMLTEKSRVKAVAAKISAARELARRLAEEKQAAVAAARFDADSDRLKRSTEVAAAQAAAEVREQGLVRGLGFRVRFRVYHSPTFVSEKFEPQSSYYSYESCFTSMGLCVLWW